MLARYEVKMVIRKYQNTTDKISVPSVSAREQIYGSMLEISSVERIAAILHPKQLLI